MDAWSATGTSFDIRLLVLQWRLTDFDFDLNQGASDRC